MRRSGIVLGVALLAFACSKENTVDASIQCEEGSEDCVPCTPDETKCDGAVLKKCQEDGKRFNSVEMCVSEALCIKGLPDGLCAPAVCTMAERKCEGATMFQCAPGQDQLVSTVCTSADACVAGLQTGACAAGQCATAADCGGQDTQCQKRSCASGKCAIEYMPKGTVCETNRQCDGNGTCAGECNKPTDCLGDDDACHWRTCTSGKCGIEKAPDMKYCPIPNQPGYSGVCSNGICMY